MFIRTALVSVMLVGASISIPHSVYSVEADLGYIQANLFVKLERLVGRLTRLADTDRFDEMIDLSLQIRHEIETHLDMEIHNSDLFKDMRSELKRRNQSISKKHVDAILKRFRSIEKSNLHHDKIVSMYIPDIVLDVDCCEDVFAILARTKHHKDTNAFNVPNNVVYGACLAYVGLAINMLPVARLKAWAVHLVDVGLDVIVLAQSND